MKLVLSYSVATKAMNKVASHINEMQKLHEEYGAVFDQLINEQTGDKKEASVITHFLFSVIHCDCNVFSHRLNFNFTIFSYFCSSQVADLSMGDLLLHCTVVWINPPAFLVKSKKDPDLAAFGKG